MILKVPIDKIKHNPYQPESRLNVPDDIAEKFGRSILEFGLLQTPVAREKPECTGFVDKKEYQMGDGWLRLSGFKWLIKNGHPDFQEMTLDIRELSDRQMADLVLEANVVRKDMSPIDRAKLFKRYLDDFKVTQTELAKPVNIKAEIFSVFYGVRN